MKKELFVFVLLGIVLVANNAFAQQAFPDSAPKAQKPVVITLTTAKQIGSVLYLRIKTEQNPVQATVDCGDGELKHVELKPFSDSPFITTKGKTIKIYLSSDSIETINFTKDDLKALDVSACKRLKVLLCAQNMLTSLNLSENVLLEKLDCSSNYLTVLDLSNNANLRSLDYDRKKIRLDLSELPLLKPAYSDKSVLKNNDKLIITMTTDLKPGTGVQMVLRAYESYFPKLKIDCGLGRFVEKNLNDRGLASDDKIMFQIEDSIIKFYASTDSIADIECSNMQLTALNVSNCKGLEVLDCSYNLLTFLDVSKNPELEFLYCYKNQLNQLDLSQNTRLRYLDCESNQLSDLDLSKNSKLERVDCSTNPITSLNLSKNLLASSVRNDSSVVVKMPNRIKADFAQRNDRRPNPKQVSVGYSFGGGYLAMPFTQRDNGTHYQNLWHLDATLLLDPEGYKWYNDDVFHIISLKGSINFLPMGLKLGKKALPSLALGYTLNYTCINKLLNKDSYFGLDLKVTVSPNYINPSIGINLVNFLKLNVGYSYGFKSFYGTQLSGFTIGIGCSLGSNFPNID